MIWIAIYLVVLLACGYAAAALLVDRSRPRRAVEVAGMTTALACGVLPILLLILSMLGIAPARGVILIIGAIVLAGIGLMKSTGRLPPIDRPIVPKLRSLEAILLPVGLILIALQLAAVTSASLQPVVDVDAWNIWGLKAKVLHTQPLSPRPDYFTDLSLSYTHLDYPLLVPMLWAGAYGMSGAMDDAAGKVWQVLPLLAIVLMLYSALRDALDRSRAMLLTAIAIGSPAVARWGGQGLADTTLAVFILGTGVCLARRITNRRTADVIAAALFAAMAGWTKLEGSIVLGSTFLVIVAVTILDRSRARTAIIFAVVATLAMLPWWIWSHGLPHTHENYLARLTPGQIAAGMQRIPELASLIWIQLSGWSWTIALLMLIAAGIAGVRGFKQPDVLAVWIILVAQLIAYGIAYLVTPWEPGEIVSTSLMRLAMHIAPLAMYLAGRHWQAVGPIPLNVKN